MTSGSELVVMGEGQTVVGDLEIFDGAHVSIENSDGPVDLFVTGRAYLGLGSQVTVTSENPSDLSLQVVGDDQAVELKAASDFYGAVYAPFSHVEIGRDFELFGFLVADTLAVESGTRLHFDSGIAGQRLPPPRLVGWRIEDIPPAVQQRVSPFQLFGYDGTEEPATITEAHQTDGWIITVEETIGLGEVAPYVGPAQSFVPGDSAWHWKIDPASFQAPTTGNKTWLVRTQYLGPDAKKETYEGPIESFQGFETLWIFEFTVWGEEDQQGQQDQQG